MGKITYKELEQEKINIEKKAKELYNGATVAEYNAYTQALDEEYRLNIAEDRDLASIIKHLKSKQPVQKDPDAVNTGLPILASTVVGGAIGSFLLEHGAFDPNFVATDPNDVIGVLLGGAALGGIAGFINSVCNCTKPITSAIIKHKLNKTQKKLDTNKRRNRAIEYMQECLRNEEKQSDSEFLDDDFPNALAEQNAPSEAINEEITM